MSNGWNCEIFVCINTYCPKFENICHNLTWSFIESVFFFTFWYLMASFHLSPTEGIGNKRLANRTISQWFSDRGVRQEIVLFYLFFNFFIITHSRRCFGVRAHSCVPSNVSAIKKWVYRALSCIETLFGQANPPEACQVAERGSQWPQHIYFCTVVWQKKKKKNQATSAV